MVLFVGFLFDQPNAFERVSLTRISLAIILLVLIILGPYDRFYTDTAHLLYSPRGVFSFIPRFSSTEFFLLKHLVIVSAFFVALGWKTRVAMPTLAASFFVFNCYVSKFSPMWSYNTHLNFFTILLCFVDSARHFSLDSRQTKSREPASDCKRDLASFAIAFMQFYVALLFFNAGLSKCLVTGVDWFLSGETPYVYSIVENPFSKPLLGLYLTQWPWLFKVITISTGIFELGFLPAFMFSRLRPALAAVGIIFSLGVLASLNITFFFLWGLYPALFMIKSHASLSSESHLPRQTFSNRSR